jgi:TPR repeat protein
MLNQSFVIPQDQLPFVQEEAINGSGLAAYRLARFYAFVLLEYDEGVRWMTISAENGHIPGILSLGVMLRISNDRLTKLRARYWLEKARVLGDDETRNAATIELEALDKELAAMQGPERR